MSPLLAAQALQAFLHIDPFALDPDGNPVASEEQIELATVGALRFNELIAHSAGMVEKPMTIQFLSGGPKVIPYKLEDSDPATLPADRTGVPDGDKGAAS